MGYACPIWRSAARSHVRKLLVLQSKCLRVASNEPWRVSNRQTYENLGIPFFADHIRALTESFDSKLADATNPLVRQLGRQLCRPRAVWNHPRLTEEGWCWAGQSGLPLKWRLSRHSDYCVPPTKVFRAFLQLQGKCQGIVQKGHGPPTPSRRGLQPKRSQPSWVQFPDAHPAKILLAKDKLPDGSPLPPVVTTLSLNTSGWNTSQL
jgi:hypothetical protein